MPDKFTVEFEKEVDGRWIADIKDIPGAMAYGQSPEEALTKALSVSKTADVG